ARRPERPAEVERDPAHRFRASCDGVEGHFDQRDRKPVQAELPRRLVLPHDPRGVLLYCDRLDADPDPLHLEVPTKPDDPGPLEAGRVRAVYHNLAHHMHLIDDVGMEEPSDLEDYVQGLAVELVRGLLVSLHEAR